MSILTIDHISKYYNLDGTNQERALNDVTLEIAPGKITAIYGPSGCGKTSLLSIISGLDSQYQGNLYFKNQNMRDFSERALTYFRKAHIGFVFQFHHLLPEFTTLENVAMPGIIRGLPRSKALGMAREALELVGLAERLDHRVTTLSGGERQRAAIARAILLRPRVLLADEPTGNLDEKTGERVGDILLDLNREVGMALVIVTHNSDLAGLMHRRYELKAGELYEQSV